MAYQVSLTRLLAIGACLAATVAQGADRLTVGADFRSISEIRFPRTKAVVDVTSPPYNAKGDGRTDDTAAIQRAVFDMMGQHRVLYFPTGTYLISKTIQFSKKNSEGKEAWGMNFLQGQSAAKTIIKLKDATFTDDKNPQSLMWCGGFGSADWFHNYIQDISFDVGDNNPGAIGLQFYSNNTGALRNCRIIAGRDSGFIGLDLAHRDMNGPLLVSNCEILGFRRGINAGRAVNSQTFEHITLRGQTQLGFENEGQPITIRGLFSDNTVPAIQTYGTFCLIGAELKGRGDAAGQPAIINYNGGRIYLRDVKTTGYRRAIGDVATPDAFAARRVEGEDKPGSLGPSINEYSSELPTRLFPTSAPPQRLPVKETPDPPRDPLARWANVDDFGADPAGDKDSSSAIQNAIDSGATTVFFPGFYNLAKPVKIRGAVSRLMGVGKWIDYNGNAKTDFIIEDGTAPILVIEHLVTINGGVEINTSRTVVFKSTIAPRIRCEKPAELFFEDAGTDDLKLLPSQKVWARQLNIENEGTHITNNGGNLWVLGYKTERGGTLVHTKNGGITEILGGFSYTTTAGKLAPMFINDNANVFAFFGEVCFNGDPFETLIVEKRNPKTRTLKRGEGSLSPYIGVSLRKE